MCNSTLYIRELGVSNNLPTDEGDSSIYNRIMCYMLLQVDKENSVYIPNNNWFIEPSFNRRFCGSLMIMLAARCKQE